ncbi:MAG: hypothetical protein Q9195_008350 [Heterodermia aff. obscurata]
MSRFIKGIGRTRANLLRDLMLTHREGTILEQDQFKCLLPLEGLKRVEFSSRDKNFDNLKDKLVRAGILDWTGAQKNGDLPLYSTALAIRHPDLKNGSVEPEPPTFSPDTYNTQHQQAVALKARASQTRPILRTKNARGPASNMKKKNFTLAALTTSSLLPTPTTPTSPALAFSTGGLNQSITQCPLNAIYFPATRSTLEFRPYPSTNSTNGTDGGLSDSCTRCGPKGCLCATVNDNTTDGILPFKSCSSCQDTDEGMVCYCAEKVEGATRCTLDNLDSGIPCHLNGVAAKAGADCTEVITSDDGGDDVARPKATGGGGKGKGVAAGAVAVAAMGAVAGMTL